MLIAALLASCSLFPAEESRAPPVIPREEIAIKTMVVERGDIGSFEYFTGTVTPVRQYNLYLDLPSAVLSDYNIDLQNLREQAGDTIFAPSRRSSSPLQNLRVKAGDVLAEFTNKDIADQVAPLKRALEMARVNYDAAMSAWEFANADYEDLQSRYERDRQDAEDAYAAAKIIYQPSDEHIFELRQAEDEYNSAISRLEQNLRAARQNAGDHAVRRERVNLAAAEDNLRAVGDQIERLVISAPVDGVITFHEVLNIGDTYTSDQVLFTIADDSEFYVTVELENMYIVLGHPLVTGAEVQISAQAIIDEKMQEVEFTGRVISASQDQRRSAMLNNETIMIEVPEWPSNVGLATSGLLVRVEQGVRYNVVAVPLSAVSMTGTYSYVRVVENGISKERPVELGLTSRTEVEILSGLEPGEEIVVR